MEAGRAGWNDLSEERPYLRILVWMVAVIVIGGFVLGFLGAILGVPIT